MRIYAVWDAFRRETQILVQIAFAVYQRLNWKKAELLNVYIVDVVDAPGR